MAEAEEIRETKHDSSFPTDLLQRFICGNQFPRKFAEERTCGNSEENIELTLGLSLNGRFGVDPERAKKLIRASSVSNFMSTTSLDETTADLSPLSPYASLTRTSSLPTETEEESRKRKELQSLRRLEAKRKRIEKLKNVRVVKEKVKHEQNSEENGGASLPINGSDGVELKKGKVDCLGGGGFEGLKPPHFLSQGSIGSQGSGSSGISDFESQPIQGANKYSEERSPASEQSLPKQKPAVSPGTTNDKSSKVKSSKVVRAALDNSSANVKVADAEENVMVKDMLADMPCVSTKGNGPNGKKIEGFLYRYRKGEEVRIVCVCHGSFLTPAEFVKHGGGGDVEHPLRHIVVSPPSFL